HRMDAEKGTIPPSTAEAVNRALDEGRRVVAVGTTSVRALESSARLGGGRVVAGAFATDLFLTPGAAFSVVSGLPTNFHLPRSTLLMLFSAFARPDTVLSAYRAAPHHTYRLFCYAAAMLVIPGAS